MELIEQLNGQHALVFYNFQHDRDRMLAALRKTGLRVQVYGGPADRRTGTRAGLTCCWRIRHLAHTASIFSRAGTISSGSV